MDWFADDRDLRHERIKTNIQPCITKAKILYWKLFITFPILSKYNGSGTPLCDTNDTQLKVKKAAFLQQELLMIFHLNQKLKLTSFNYIEQGLVLTWKC